MMPLNHGTTRCRFRAAWIFPLLFGTDLAQTQTLQENSNQMLGGNSGTITIPSLPAPTPDPQLGTLNPPATTGITLAPANQPTAPSIPKVKDSKSIQQKLHTKTTVNVGPQLRQGALRNISAKLKVQPTDSKLGFKTPAGRKLPAGKGLDASKPDMNLPGVGNRGFGNNPLKSLFPGMANPGGINTRLGNPGMGLPGAIIRLGKTSPAGTTAPGSGKLSGLGTKKPGLGANPTNLPSSTDVFGKKPGSFGFFGSKRPGNTGQDGKTGKSLP
ncbi:MAG TPA: hypothetical protein ENI62_05575, partial [Gammaproteobacteria bacterium]|nr:hypothetical protein [Gammaproteobacteria bacterium]